MWTKMGRQSTKSALIFQPKKVLKMKVFLLLILCISFVPGKSFTYISVNDNS